MPLDDTIALVTRNMVKNYLGIDSSTDDPDADALIDSLINSASQEISRLCNGRKFRKVATAIDEIFDGDGENNYFTRNAPITNSPTLYYWDGATWQNDPSWSTTQDNNRGEIWFDDGNIFFEGRRNWKISYTYGWDINDIPADLQLACLRLVALNKKLFNDSLHGVNSKSFGDQSISYTFDKIPASVLSTIYSYRRIR